VRAMDEPLDPRIDRSRAAVYLAEDHVAAGMDSPTRAVVIDGALHSLPPPLVFGEIDAMQRYADAVLAHPATLELAPDPGRVQVVTARGFRRATYRAGVISIPAANRRGQWAMRDTVLLHELAHHLADGHGHGPAFRAILVRLYRTHVSTGAAMLLARGFQHIDGLPESDSVPAPGRTDQLRRVAALLAKAESTTHQQEAEAYLARAAILAQRHSIDLAVAALSATTPDESPTRRMISIGEPRRALNGRFVSLLVAIARAWGVRADIGPSSTYVIVYGMPSDLDQVESVYATASTMMVSHAAAHVRAGGWRGTSYWASSGGRRPVTAAVARNAFCLGFTERLGERVAEAQQTARRQAADETGVVPGEDVGAELMAAGSRPRSPGRVSAGQAIELALHRRQAAVKEYHEQSSRAKGTWRGTSGGSWSASGSRAAGQRAAESYGAASLRRGRRELPAGADP
jgi:putative metallohydrolase (TIGR04338 family)